MPCRGQRRGLEAALAGAERRLADLLSILPETDDGPCSVFVLPRIARAQLELGRTDAAIEAYEAYVSTPYIWRTWMEAGAPSGTCDDNSDGITPQTGPIRVIGI